MKCLGRLWSFHSIESIWLYSLLLRKSMLRLALRRACFASTYEMFAALVDGRCFLNGFDISRKSSSDCVTDKSDKNDPVELISLPYLSSKRFDFDFRLRCDILRNANLLRVSSLMSRSVCKNSHALDNFRSCLNNAPIYFRRLIRIKTFSTH